MLQHKATLPACCWKEPQSPSSSNPTPPITPGCSKPCPRTLPGVQGPPHPHPIPSWAQMSLTGMSRKGWNEIPSGKKERMTLASCNPGSFVQHSIPRGNTACPEDLEVDLELAGSHPAGRAAGQAVHRDQQGVGSIQGIASFAQVEGDQIPEVSEPARRK